MKLEDLIDDWVNASEALKEAKKTEMALRNQIIAYHKPKKTKTEGAETYSHPSINCKVIVKYTVNRSIDRAGLDNIWKDLSDIDKDAVNWKPELKLSNYRKLDDDSELVALVTEKEGQASLEIKDI